MLTNYIWLIVLQLSTIKLCKSAHATTRTYFERRFMTTAILNQHFQSTLLGGGDGVTKKSTLCTLVKMMTIMDDPLVENVSSVLVTVVSSAYITNLNFSLDKAKSLTYMMNNNGLELNLEALLSIYLAFWMLYLPFLRTAFYLLNNFLLILMGYHVCSNTVI